jgi:2-polyprenyl-3-methyl-5-hydroxy-6-metoxy-1,4-benzoquinol methylase
MFRFRERKLNLDEKWLNSLKKDIDESYIRHTEPWKQAGFMMTEEDWVTCRKPVADCIQKSGTFLDINCSNGYFLESILKWTASRGLSITPYGIDLSAKLIALAKARLPKYADNLVVGTAPHWTAPTQFDYVRTELAYALEEAQEQYLHKVFSSYVAPEGNVILTEYRTKKESPKTPWMDEKVRKWDFDIVYQTSGYCDNKELTRVLVLTRRF